MAPPHVVPRAWSPECGYPLPLEDLVQRLAGRRVCRGCGAMLQAAEAGRRQCDHCAGELYQREDDREETVRHRMGVYAKETALVQGHYRGAHLLREVDGIGTREDVFSRMTASLG